MFLATTAGRGQENLSDDIVDYARKVARGEIDDPATLPVLFETPADADWKDEAIWAVANPGLKHGFPDIEGFASSRARPRTARRPRGVQAISLEYWADASLNPFVEMSVYDQGNAQVDLKSLRALLAGLASTYREQRLDGHCRGVA